MRTVYKYQVTPLTTEIETAKLIRVVHVASDYSDQYKSLKEFGPVSRAELINAERITFWAEVDNDFEQTTEINIAGTGHRIPMDRIHCGTAVMPGGLVWHLYIPFFQVPFQTDPINGYGHVQPDYRRKSQ